MKHGCFVIRKTVSEMQAILNATTQTWSSMMCKILSLYCLVLFILPSLLEYAACFDSLKNCVWISSEWWLIELQSFERAQ